MDVAGLAQEGIEAFHIGVVFLGQHKQVVELIHRGGHFRTQLLQHIAAVVDGGRDVVRPQRARQSVHAAIQHGGEAAQIRVFLDGGLEVGHVLIDVLVVIQEHAAFHAVGLQLGGGERGIDHVRDIARRQLQVDLGVPVRHGEVFPLKLHVGQLRPVLDGFILVVVIRVLARMPRQGGVGYRFVRDGITGAVEVLVPFREGKARTGAQRQGEYQGQCKDSLHKFQASFLFLLTATRPQ